MFWQGLIILVPFVVFGAVALVAHALGCIFN